ncbi:hypothetical protein FGO68_gene15701 [Halteria grandinella]|uniref:TmcB/TmcC TPR repeats domain-containing protein n=1 Tax=Halteria grandinella TaxID=5974 RepID=A0A8J8P8V4_HALGN|nr:hypothetical protein FGO68_gene15701 [Halteria grandinella]
MKKSSKAANKDEEQVQENTIEIVDDHNSASTKAQSMKDETGKSQSRKEKQGEKKQEERMYFTSIDAFKIDDMVQQFSVLESNAQKRSLKCVNSDDLGMGNSLSINGMSSSSGMRKFSALLKKRVFKINFVLFHQRPFGHLVYQLFLIIEFLQLFFLVYYKVSARNGYINPRLEKLNVEDYVGKLLGDLSASQYNITMEKAKLLHMLSSKQILTIEDNLVRMDNLVMFAIPSLYYLNADNQSNFYNTYWAVVGLFYGVIAFYLGLGPIMFKAIKRNQLNSQFEGLKIMNQVLANIVLILVTIAQVPIFTLLFQGFLCDEDPLQDYSIPGVSCGDSTHQLYVLFSAITFILYIAFSYTVFILKHSERLGSPHPWASNNSIIPLVKAAIKLILTASFILDKNAEYKSGVAFGALALVLYKLIKRFRDSIYFNRRIQYTSTSLDIIIAYHLVFVNIHLVAHEIQSVSTIFIFLLNSLIFLALFGALQEFKLTKLKKEDPDGMVKRGGHNFDIYVQQMFEMIKRLSDLDKIILFGKLYSHAEECRIDKTCICGDLLQKLETMKKYHQFSLHANLRRGNSDIVKQASKDTPTVTSINVIKESRDLITFHDQAMTSGTFLNPLTNIPQGYMGSISISAMDIGCDGNVDQRENNSVPLTQREEKRLIEDENIAANMKYEEMFGHPIEVEFVEENQWYLDQERQNVQNEKIRRVFYQFIIQLIENVAAKQPRKASLRLQVTNLLKNQLSKIFKAYYELQKCSKMKDMTFNEKYQEYEHHKFIEQQLIGLHLKQTSQNSMLDVEHLIEYNKSFLKFQKNEILAARATLNFWRQLLQRDFDAQVLQQHGFEITRCFARVTDAAQEINRISPGDIKFHFRLGMFLIKIINNEYDGIEALRTANIKYALRSDGREEANLDVNDEVKKVVFSDNQGYAMVVLSTNVAQFGKILHANCEIESIFGFQRKDILEKHISSLMPHLIGKYHDHFVHKFLQSGKIRFTDILKQSFGQNRDRFLLPIDLMIKVYPKISGGIKLVALIKPTVIGRSDLMKSEYNEHYIMTDRLGYICNISAGLVGQLGLHPAFFNYDDSSFQSMVRIDKIIPNAAFEGMEEFADQLANPVGFTLTFDTVNLLQKVETEVLSHEELEII